MVIVHSFTQPVEVNGTRITSASKRTAEDIAAPDIVDGAQLAAQRHQLGAASKAASKQRM